MLYNPEIISWNITGGCNLRCAHCYLDAGETRQGELSTGECFQVIDQMAELGTGMVILTGGEPLLRKDLLTIVSYARERGITAVLGTNGTLIDDSMAAALKRAGLQGAGISLDSLRSEKHDSFRGMNGCWEMAVGGMRSCIRQGLPVIIQTTLTPWNYGEIPPLIDFACQEGAAAFNLYYLVCTGRGEKLTDISPQRYEESLVSLVEAQARYPSMMIRARCAPQMYRISHEAGAIPAGGGCPAGVSYLRIGPQGEVTPCPYLPVVVGNARDTALKEIWEKAAALIHLRERRLEGRCGDCDFRESCSGCRARALALMGDYRGEDPWCHYQPGRHPASPTAAVAWTPKAEAVIQRVPSFARNKVKMAVEGLARDRGYPVITAHFMAEVRSRMAGRMRPGH